MAITESLFPNIRLALLIVAIAPQSPVAVSPLMVSLLLVYP